MYRRSRVLINYVVFFILSPAFVLWRYIKMNLMHGIGLKRIAENKLTAYLEAGAEFTA
jgi:hypothetical protein